MDKKLSILIPTLYGRENFCQRIEKELWRQIDLLGVRNGKNGVNVCTMKDDRQLTTGAKRNDLIKFAQSEYIAFVDDDDMVTDCYIQKQLEVANSGMDAGELKGLYFLNGVYGKPFWHSQQYTHWYTTKEAYIRTINHLNCIRRDIALQVPYEDITVGEDGRYSEKLKAMNLVKTEYPMEETIYLYYDRTK